MVVHDFDVVDAAIPPPEADPPLVIDLDAVLALAISAKGFSEDPAAFDAVLPLITEALLRAAEEGISDPHQLQQIVRRTVGRWVNEKYRRRPMIVPNVVEV